jgi:N-acetylneuraminate synthase
MKNIFIIAEAGVNHNGDIELAKKMVDVAAKAGADAIKFQTFKAEEVISRFAPKAEYQKKTTGKDESQLDMVRKLELSRDDHKELLKRSSSKKIAFLSTAFDMQSLEFLQELGLKIFKIPSGEITNTPYLKKIGGFKKKILLSSGMASLKEIKYALDVLVNAGTRKRDITVLQCTTQYPAPADEANLRAMLTIRDSLNVDVGYSDHTIGIDLSLAAAALGAKVIEKHFTLDKKLRGPDHLSSLEPDELALLIRSVRNIEKAMGDGIKRPSKSEIKNIPIVRKSIVAGIAIEKDSVIKEHMLKIKRPGTGIQPRYLDKLIGKKVKCDIEKDAIITWKDITKW